MQIIECVSTGNGTVSVTVEAPTYDEVIGTASRQLATKAAVEKLGRASLEKVMPAIPIGDNGQPILRPDPSAKAVVFRQTTRFRTSL